MREGGRGRESGRETGREGECWIQLELLNKHIVLCGRRRSFLSSLIPHFSTRPFYLFGIVLISVAIYFFIPLFGVLQTGLYIYSR